MSEALIFASTNPQYDDRLFIELQVQYLKIPSSYLGRTCCVSTEIISDIQNNFCTQHVLPMFCKKKCFWQRLTCRIGFYIVWFACFVHLSVLCHILDVLPTLITSWMLMCFLLFFSFFQQNLVHLIFYVTECSFCSTDRRDPSL